MQITIDINEELYQELLKKAQEDGLSIEEEIEHLIIADKNNKSFYSWAKSKEWISKSNDASIKHDDYLYGNKSK